MLMMHRKTKKRQNKTPKYLIGKKSLESLG